MRWKGVTGLGIAGFGGAVLGAQFLAAQPASADILVNISKSQQRLEVIVDGAEAFRWPVSTGRAGHTTPSGHFRPHDIARHWYSHQYARAPMPYAVFFHRGYAVHGTTETYNLGHPASHGCVRLRPDNAAILFWLVRKHGIKNTKVVVMNGPLPKAPPALPQQPPPRLPPAGVPMADASSAPAPAAGHESAAKVLPTADDGQVQELSAKVEEAFAKASLDEAQPSHPARRAEAAPRERRAHIARHRAGAGRYAVASDEARVLREREAWLRGLDRKYGITR